MSFSYVTMRLAQIVPTFFLMMLVIFGLVRLLPGVAALEPDSPLSRTAGEGGVRPEGSGG